MVSCFLSFLQWSSKVIIRWPSSVMYACMFVKMTTYVADFSTYLCCLKNCFVDHFFKRKKNWKNVNSGETSEIRPVCRALGGAGARKWTHRSLPPTTALPMPSCSHLPGVFFTSDHSMPKSLKIKYNSDGPADDWDDLVKVTGTRWMRMDWSVSRTLKEPYVQQ